MPGLGFQVWGHSPAAPRGCSSLKIQTLQHNISLLSQTPRNEFARRFSYFQRRVAAWQQLPRKPPNGNGFQVCVLEIQKLKSTGPGD